MNTTKTRKFKAGDKVRTIAKPYLSSRVGTIKEIVPSPTNPKTTLYLLQEGGLFSAEELERYPARHNNNNNKATWTTPMNRTESRIANRLIRDLLQEGFVVSVNNGGDDNEVDLSTSLRAILGAMFAASCDTLLVYRPPASPSGPYVYVGAVLLVTGNGADLISDYSLSLEPYMRGASDLADQLS